MKKYIPLIIAFVIGAIIAVAVYRLFAPKPTPEYKVDIEKQEILEQARQKSIDSMVVLYEKYQKDSTKIEIRYEKVFDKPVTNRIGDSLARAILRAVK